MTPNVPCLVLIIIVGSLFIIQLPAVSSETIVVDDDGGSWANFTKIQDALDNSTDGDVIRVFNGTYTSPISIDTSISLVGNGSDEVVHTTSGYSCSIWDENVHISGISFKDSIRAIYIRGHHTIIDNCSFVNLSRGIVISENRCLIENVTMVDIHELSIDIGWRYHRIRDCILGKPGITISYSVTQPYSFHTHEITNVSVDGKPVAYIKNASNIKLDNATSQIFLGNCTNVTIENHRTTGLYIAINTLSTRRLRIVNSSSSGSEMKFGQCEDVQLINYCSDNGKLSLYTSNYVHCDNLRLRDSSTGLSLWKTNNFSVSNLHIENMTTYGISIRQSPNGSMENVYINNTGISGIYTEDSDFYNITNLHSSNHSSPCIDALNSDYYNLSNVTLIDGSIGIYQDRNNHWNIIDSHVAWNYGRGIYFSGWGSAVYNSRIHNNGGDGVKGGSSVYDSFIYSNDGVGLYNGYGYNCTIFNNTGYGVQSVRELVDSEVYGNMEGGVYSTWGAGAIIESTYVHNNSEFGIQVMSAIEILNSTLSENELIGVDIQNPATLVNSTISHHETGVFARYMNFNITRSRIYENSVGLKLQRTGTVIDTQIMNSNVTEIWSTSWGWVVFRNTSISGNESIYMPYPASLRFTNCSLQGLINQTDGTINLVNTTFDQLSISEDGYLEVRQYLHLQTQDTDGSPLANCHARIRDNSEVIYRTSKFGGTDDRTDTAGYIEWVVITDRAYSGSNTPVENVTTVRVVYKGWLEDRDVNMSSSHTEIFIYSYDGNFIVDDDNQGDPLMDGSPLHPFDEIDYAVDNATSGKNIQVYEGNYSHPVSINNAISINGNGSLVTKLEVSGGNAININTSDVRGVSISQLRIVGQSKNYIGIDVESSYFSMWSMNITGFEYGVSIEDSVNNSISGSIVDNDVGIFVKNCTNLTFTDGLLTNNRIGMIVRSDSTDVRVQISEISDNSEFGIEASSNVDVVNATYLWWGDASGPYHTTNPNGLGDNVSANVEFVPWVPFGRIESISPKNATEGDEITFTGTGIVRGTAIRYQWRSDIDGILYNGTSNSFSTSTLSNGTHEIYFKVLDSATDWTLEANDTIHINGRPHAVIASIIPSPADEGETIEFFGAGIDDGAIDRYLWASDIDGVFYNGTEPSFETRNLSGGDHQITLIVTDDYGVMSVPASTPLHVNELPVAFISSIDPINSTVGDEVTFILTGTDDGSITGYSISSSLDGELYIGDQSVFQTTDLSNGTHNISVQVKDDNDAWSMPVFFEISVNAIPIARIASISPNPASIRSNITFTGEGWGDENISRYSWTSGIDGVLYNGTSTSFSMMNLSEGDHIISLIVMDSLGAWSYPVSENLSISSTPHALIRSISPNPATEGEVISFNGTSVEGIPLASYEWISNIDGPLYNGSNESFMSFLSNGTHNISFRVLDEFAVWSNWINESIVVNGRPIAQIISVTPNPLKFGETVSLQGSGIDDGHIVRYVWSFIPDGEIANGTSQNLSAEGLSEGKGEIRLVVIDNNGAQSLPAVIQLVVNRPPRVVIGLPLNHSTVSGEVQINGTLSDAFSKSPPYVELSIDYGPWVRVNGADDWYYIIDSTTLENAQHLIRVRGFDGYHYSKTVSITLEVDNEEEPSSDGATDNTFTIALIVGIVIAVLVAVIVYLMFIRVGEEQK